MSCAFPFRCRLVWLREMGIMDRWIAQMLGNWDHCRRDGNRVTLTFEDTYAIFVMWALLVTTSLAVFGFEKLRYACDTRKIRQQTVASSDDAGVVRSARFSVAPQGIAEGDSGECD